MSNYYSLLLQADTYDDESIGDERSEEGEYQYADDVPGGGFTHVPRPTLSSSPYHFHSLPDTDDASETEFRSPSRYGAMNGTSNSNNMGTNSELKEQ